MTQEARRFFTEGNSVQTDGRQLYSLMQEQHFPSFRVRTEPLLQLPTINAVIIVGSTAKGKTTLERTIRAAHIPNISVPKKVITRELRLDDNPEEVIPMTPGEFTTMADSDQMGRSCVF